MQLLTSSAIVMKKAELVFIPSPGLIGHLVSMVEVAKLLIDQDDRLSITILIMDLPFDSMVSTYTKSLASSSTTGRIRLIHLPREDVLSELNPSFVYLFVENQKPHVRNAIAKLTLSESGSDSSRLAGLVVDMFCTTMIDVAHEFGVPSYVFFTSSAGFLRLILHMQTLLHDHNLDLTEFNDSDAELVVPSFANAVPARVLPSMALDKEGGLNQARRFRETKGIIVNTFMELESHAVDSFSDGTTPLVYPIGPIINLKGETQVGSSGTHNNLDIMSWLDDQPRSSVVFLCFGSMGSFSVDQVKEIARGVECSGYRFLWSLRQPPLDDKIAMPNDYTNPKEVLPEAFSDRTAGIGKVIGWAPQVAILAHQAIGGFVSHCGWNSILESLWCGVPIATWPIYAEQQLNAFEMVRELGLAVEIRLDYKNEFGKGGDDLVTAEEIERGIRRVMDGDGEVRKKVKEMGEKSKKALMDGGSSSSLLGHLVKDMMDNMP